MIRVGSTSTGFSTKLNTFHGQTTSSTGFWVNVSGGDPPPPTEPSNFGSEFTSAPWLRINSTLGIDPYGFTQVPFEVSTFYMDIRLTYEITNGGFTLSWGDGYSSNINALVPSGPLTAVVYGEPEDKVTLRVNSKGKTYRLYEIREAAIVTMAFVGPENASKVVPNEGSDVYFDLSGLTGVNGCLSFFDVTGGYSTTVITKEDSLPFSANFYKGSVKTLNESWPYSERTLNFWVFK